MSKYQLTDEHRAQLEPWANKWTANAMSTEPMDRERAALAAVKMYEAAELSPPRVVFVPSPFVLRFAGGFAAAIWHLRGEGGAGDNPWEAICGDSVYEESAVSATYRATRAATFAMVETSSSAEALGGGAIHVVRDNDTRDAVVAAINNNDSDDKWYCGCDWKPALEALFPPEHRKFALQCAVSAYGMWQGGNQWPYMDSLISFFRHVAKLDIDYSKWQWWEELALTSGPRIVHKEFCMISDRPEVFTVDSDHRPHNETGPFCQWRDGTKMYALNGVYVPRWLVERSPADLDPQQIADIDNAEVRREFVRKVGAERIVSTLSTGAIDKRTYTTADGREHKYELHRLTIHGNSWTYLKMQNPSVFLTHFEGVANECNTVQEALNWRNGLDGSMVSDDGADWIQQGDVLLFPEGAEKFKPFPMQLT